MKSTTNRLTGLWLNFSARPVPIALMEGLKKALENSSRFICTDLTFELPDNILPGGSITFGVRPEDWVISPPESSQIKAVIIASKTWVTTAYLMFFAEAIELS